MAVGHTEGTRRVHHLQADDLVIPAAALGRPVPRIIRRLMLEIARRFAEAASLPDDVAIRAHLAPVEEDLRQVMQWTKRAGRTKKGETIGDRRAAMRARGHTLEEIADIEGVDIDVVKRSMRPSRTKKKGGQ